jgi:hypothetical protein
MLRRQHPDPMKREEQLEIHRLLRPKRAVVIKSGNAFGGRDEMGRTRFGYFRDKRDDCFF